MSLYQELTHIGVFDQDAQLLDQLFGTEPDFMVGLEQMAEVYFTNTKPGKFAPPGEPWKKFYGAVISSNGLSAEAAFEAALAQEDPALQMALSDALSKAWHVVTVTAAKGKRKNVKSREYVQVLESMGYQFRMNDCNDELEVNGAPITDPLRAEIRSRLRDAGYAFVHVAEDAYTAHGWKKRYHPIREYFDTLQYDGGDHIGKLAGHFQDKDGVFGLWFRRWLIGAVAKVFEGGQNAMFVLDGPQGCGKSFFASWLCPPSIREYFIESPINPDDKDAHIRLISKWIWEVAELGSTTRKADREALKFFISQRTVTVRKAYGRYDTRKRAMASLIGTVNNEAGLLADKTGNRRFLVCKLEHVDWSYAKTIDIDQVWAEAQALYLAGEKWELTPAEQKRASEINEVYEIDDPIEGLLLKYFEVNPSLPAWTPTAEILQTLEINGLRGNTRANAMGLAAVMTKLGMEKKRRHNTQGQLVWGYEGVRNIV